MNLDKPTAEDYQHLGAMVDQMQSRFIRGVPTADVFAPLLVDLLTEVDDFQPLQGSLHFFSAHPSQEC